MMRYLYGTVVLATILLLGSCVSPFQKELTPSMVSAQDVIIVASVDLTPRIQYEKYSWDAKDQLEVEISNKPSVGVVFSHLPVLFNVEAGIHDLRSFGTYGPYCSADAEVGELLIGKAMKQEYVYMRGFFLELGRGYNVYAKPRPNLIAPATWTGKFAITVPEGARAIYLGHFEIKLNDVYQAIGYTIKDRYDSAKVSFEEKFPGFELVRADLQEVSGK